VEAPAPPPEALGAVAAALHRPTGRYPHDVLGGIPAFTRLTVTLRACAGCGPRTEAAVLAPPWVFEDVAPRLWDADGDGRAEVVVVESHERLGARLAVWGPGPAGLRRLAATAPIGTRFRWLAPAGIGDFAGDGRPVIAYVDRPHLAREIVFVRMQGRRLAEIARAPGYSNHRIGETAIASGTRRCGGRDEVVVPRAAGGLAALRLEGGRIAARDAGPFRGPADLARALGCP
jgi:hypothetical protein